MDRVTLCGIRAYGRHGAAPGERARRQLIELDVTLDLDLAAAGRDDDLRSTLDYAGLHLTIVRIVATTSYALLERIGAEVLDAIFADVRVARAAVSLRKPALLDGATPGVRLERENPRFAR